MNSILAPATHDSISELLIALRYFLRGRISHIPEDCLSEFPVSSPARDQSMIALLLSSHMDCQRAAVALETREDVTILYVATEPPPSEKLKGDVEDLLRKVLASSDAERQTVFVREVYLLWLFEALVQRSKDSELRLQSHMTTVDAWIKSQLGKGRDTDVGEEGHDTDVEEEGRDTDIGEDRDTDVDSDVDEEDIESLLRRVSTDVETLWHLLGHSAQSIGQQLHPALRRLSIDLIDLRNRVEYSGMFYSRYTQRAVLMCVRRYNTGVHRRSSYLRCTCIGCELCQPHRKETRQLDGELG